MAFGLNLTDILGGPAAGVVDWAATKLFGDMGYGSESGSKSGTVFDPRMAQQMGDFVTQQQENYIKAVQKALPNMLSSAAGLTGQAARVGFEKAQQSFAPGASAAETSALLRGQGSLGLSSALAAGQAQAKAAELANKNITDQMMGALQARGGPISAMTKSATDIGGKLGENLMSAQQQSAALMNEAGRGNLQALSQAENVMQSDLAQRFQREVQPYLTQVNQAGLSGLSNAYGLTGIFQQSSSSAKGDKIMMNPLAPMTDIWKFDAGAKHAIDAANEVGGGG